MSNFPLKILYFLIPAVLILIFIVDIFFYYSRINFLLISNLKEIALLLLLIAIFFIIRHKFSFEILSLRSKLIRLSILIIANYLVMFILDILFDPRYSQDFPATYQSFSAIIFSTIIAVVGIGTLIPILLIFRDLIFYKQKRWTGLIFNLFLISTVLTGLSVALSKQPLEFHFSAQTVYNDISFLITIVLIALLSFRNDWITYLPRKEKMLFFALGIFVYTAIVNLFDTVYSKYLTSYSLFVATFSNVIWLFMLFYGGFAVIKLLFHLPTAKAFDRKIKEVNSLYDLARTLNSELNIQRLTQLITQLTARVLESHSTWLELHDASNERLDVISHINLTSEQIIRNPFHNLSGFNQEIIKAKKPILINDIGQLKHLQYILRWKQNARALIAAPLFSNRGQLMGIIYATKTQPFGFDVDDVSLLEGFANQASIALENAQLLQESLERERLEQELKIAREVQLKLLPQELPQIPSLQIDTLSLTAYEVGGDYYDFIQFADNLPGVVIGDVSGKGTSAAFYMAEFKGVIQTLAQTLDDPKELVSQANQIFYSNIERKMFLSAVIGKFFPQQKAFQIVRAGHTPIIHCSGKSGELSEVLPAGLAIGLDSGELFNKIIEVANIPLQYGDIIIFYTDGLIEARNQTGEDFGEQRLCELVKQSRHLGAPKLREKIREEIRQFVGQTPLHDDLTLIIMKFTQHEYCED